MRHGAGPNVSTPDNNLECRDDRTAAALMNELSLKDVGAKQRLGCYFCSDVVAPMDVIFSAVLMRLLFWLFNGTIYWLFRIYAVDIQPHFGPTMYSHKAWPRTHCCFPFRRIDGKYFKSSSPVILNVSTEVTFSPCKFFVWFIVMVVPFAGYSHQVRLPAL